MNESVDVILHQLGLGGADPIDDALQQLGEQQHNRHQQRRPQYRPPVASTADSGDNTVDQGTGEIDRRYRKKSLNQKQDGPGDGPAGRGLPYQAQRACEVSQLKRRATKAVGEVV